MPSWYPSILITLTAASTMLAVACNQQVSRSSESSSLVRWDEKNTQEPLTVSSDGLSLSWETDQEFAWLGSQTTARLQDGVFTWDFRIDAIAGRQIGVGVMLDPPDWGFYGYLGAGKNTWSYDAFEGAIVTETEAIHTGLPTIRDSGIVSVHLDLKTKHKLVFIVDGVETPSISLPPRSVVIPAACLLGRGQKVTLTNFRQLE